MFLHDRMHLTSFCLLHRVSFRRKKKDEVAAKKEEKPGSKKEEKVRSNGVRVVQPTLPSTIDASG
jgi:hypothetical protein